ncbi:hypothetical protein AB0M50_11705 [Nonomuraea fuscirosea]|uniref:hypothetical protein n=1 Tax=Nonomuraea fuscirosea TaxID=1291556 RepID=UPI003428968D
MTNPVLVKNALYQAGPLPTTTRNDLPDGPTTPAEARTYINEALRCLENTAHADNVIRPGHGHAELSAA